MWLLEQILPFCHHDLLSHSTLCLARISFLLSHLTSNRCFVASLCSLSRVGRGEGGRGEGMGEGEEERGWGRGERGGGRGERGGDSFIKKGR